MLTQEELKQKLIYDPETGIFTWIPRPRSFRRNYVAGGQMLNGYITIGVGKPYLAHRLAFLYMTGQFPTNQVDHINRIRNDNRWCNLRDATSSENSFNKSVVGVYEFIRKGRQGLWYEAKIQKYGKQYSSTFRSKEKAIAWRANKEKELFGTFQKI